VVLAKRAGIVGKPPLTGRKVPQSLIKVKAQRIKPMLKRQVTSPCKWARDKLEKRSDLKQGSSLFFGLDALKKIMLNRA